MLEIKPPDNNPFAKDPDVLAVQRAALITGQWKTIRDNLAPGITPPQGKTTVDKVSIESEILAYEAIEKIAEKISEVVAHQSQPAAPAQVIVHTGADLGSLPIYRAFLVQAAMIQRVFADLLPPPEQTAMVAAAAVGLVVTAVKSAVDLVSLFRVDTDIKSGDLTANETALVATVARALQKKSLVVFYPVVQPLYFDPAASRTLAELSKIHELEGQAEAEVAAQEAAGSAEAPRLRARLEAAKLLLQSFNTTLDTPDVNGVTPISRILPGEILASKLEAGAYVLQLAAVKLRGSVRTKQNLFGSKVSYSGGAIVAYLLFSPQGQIVSADTICVHSGYRSFDSDEEG